MLGWFQELYLSIKSGVVPSFGLCVGRVRGDR